MKRAIGWGTWSIVLLAVTLCLMFTVSRDV